MHVDELIMKAKALEAEGQLKAAFDLLQRALAVLSETEGADPKRVVIVLQSLAEVLTAMQLWDAARSMLSSVMNLQEARSERALTQVSMGVLGCRMGEREEGMKQLREAHEALAEELGAEDETVKALSPVLAEHALSPVGPYMVHARAVVGDIPVSASRLERLGYRAFLRANLGEVMPVLVAAEVRTPGKLVDDPQGMHMPGKGVFEFDGWEELMERVEHLRDWFFGEAKEISTLCATLDAETLNLPEVDDGDRGALIDEAVAVVRKQGPDLEEELPLWRHAAAVALGIEDKKRVGLARMLVHALPDKQEVFLEGWSELLREGDREEILAKG